MYVFLKIITFYLYKIFIYLSLFKYMKTINHQRQIMKKENLKPKKIRAARLEKKSFKRSIIRDKKQNINSIKFISKSCSCYSSLSPQTSSNKQ